jgi:hypothetical protein
MQIGIPPILLTAMLAGILALVAPMIAFRMRPARQSRIAVVAALLPPLLMLLLFYSLAIHMHKSLGTWPTSIGEQGFPALLITHDTIATNYFTVLTLISIFAWPVAFLLCAIVRRWRVCVYYLCLYGFACLACLVAMLLAPSPFLNWWWD